jgi:hypothetical protein
MIFKDIFIAILICIINTGIAIFVVEFAFKKKNEQFNKIVLSSMVIRYFVMIFVAWLTLAVIGLNKFRFSFTLIVTSFLLLIFEILYYHFRAKSLNLQNYLTNKG